MEKFAEKILLNGNLKETQKNILVRIEKIWRELDYGTTDYFTVYQIHPVPIHEKILSTFTKKTAREKYVGTGSYRFRKVKGDKNYLIKLVINYSNDFILKKENLTWEEIEQYFLQMVINEKQLENIIEN